MAAYILRRLLGILPVLILVALGSFLLVHLVPGDPAMVMLGNDATPQQIQALKTQMGLDRSLPE
ncbi:MAG: ABC transporter permease, partial [candidate division NC10 bacterium]|nr:ABC transporter permease [candidate division NC10 bacterium]